MLGMAVGTWMPGVAERLAPLVGRVATLLLALAVLMLLAGSWRALWAAVGDGTLVALVVFVAIGLLVGHLLGGPDPDHSVVLALSTASRHPAIALSIASAEFPGRALRRHDSAVPDRRCRRGHALSSVAPAPCLQRSRIRTGLAQRLSHPWRAWPLHNWDHPVGLDDDTRFKLNFQPVVPNGLNDDRNLNSQGSNPSP